MNRLGLKTLIFNGDSCLGEVEIFSTRNQNFQFPNNEIRITHITQPSERCPPLSILQTISPFTVRCKLKSSSLAEITQLNALYFSCLHERKTAVVVFGGEELHLVAMPSKQEKPPCFWCCSVPIGLYGSCLGMLNLRCLAIVFDLDETLIVANTMKSFEDRIEFLQKRLEDENDPLRVSGMSAELRRYVEDRSLLKQYTENDNVMDSGKSYSVQLEEVHLLSNDQEKIVRPIIRLKERNIVLTRINPEIRDTSVLVRLRPAWEELRGYLNAKGRKRFEVYVCTMAERDYALEMWRLLDPDAHLISSNQLLNRVVCVKSGSRKSLPGVFQSGMCHPKMAMVIDDRQKVWEDNDQPRVHVVPAFTPYYSPQAETAYVVPVLCIARNVACNVRAGFFKEFDENLLGKIFELCYEDEVASLPCSPDVSNFLMAEDTYFVPNGNYGNKDLPIPEGMNGAEVEQRMNKVDEKHKLDLECPFVTKNPELKPEASQPPVLTSPDVGNSETSRTEFPLLKSGLPEASFGMEAMEANPSDFDPEKWRRHYTLQHGQDTGKQNPTIPLLSRLSTNVSLPSIKSSGGWLVEEDQVDNVAARPTQQFDASQDKQQAHQNLNCSKTESILSGPSSHVAEVKSEEAYGRHKTKQHNHSQLNQSFLTEGEISINQAPASNKELQVEAQKFVPLPSYLYIGVLQEIGRKCGSKVEFRSVVSTSKDLQFSVEVLFAGDKIGAGMGKTKKDAQLQAAENALRTLADEYEEYTRSDPGSVGRNSSKDSHSNENGILWDDPHDELPSKDALSIARTSEAIRGANGSLKSLGTQETHKRANSPRSEESSQNKKLKGEVVPGFR